MSEEAERYGKVEVAPDPQPVMHSFTCMRCRAITNVPADQPVLAWICPCGGNEFQVRFLLG